ncbi:MAG TPA: hypothetical protein VK206_01185, partial [Anaerolineales bacterium]|nr:hypothetical protein [Anaerolineales bacterium]
VCKRLDAIGRGKQLLMALADGAFDVLELWRALPQRTVLLTCTARNRSLSYLPTDYAGRGRPPRYGEKAPAPADWLHAGLRNWPNLWVQVRGKQIRMRFQVLGPFVREGLPERPLFLIVVKGMHKQVGKRKIHYKLRGPSFYLVNAIFKNGAWRLLLPIDSILAWLWQRWEIEVAHREMKSGLVLAAWRTWGLHGLSNTCTPWWTGPKRWSFNTIWRQYRSQLWALHLFAPFGCHPPTTGSKKNSGWRVYPTPSPFLPESKAECALLLHIPLLLFPQLSLNEPKSRGFIFPPAKHSTKYFKFRCLVISLTSTILPMHLIAK